MCFISRRPLTRQCNNKPEGTVWLLLHGYNLDNGFIQVWNCWHIHVHYRLNLVLYECYPPPPILQCSPTDEYEGSRGQTIGSVSPVHDLRLLLHVGGLLCSNDGFSRQTVQLCAGHHAEQINVSRGGVWTYCHFYIYVWCHLYFGITLTLSPPYHVPYSTEITPTSEITPTPTFEWKFLHRLILCKRKLVSSEYS